MNPDNKYDYIYEKEYNWYPKDDPIFPAISVQPEPKPYVPNPALAAELVIRFPVQKINAIKEYRAATNGGLKECKEAIEVAYEAMKNAPTAKIINMSAIVQNLIVGIAIQNSQVLISDLVAVTGLSKNEALNVVNQTIANMKKRPETR